MDATTIGSLSAVRMEYQSSSYNSHPNALSTIHKPVNWIHLFSSGQWFRSKETPIFSDNSLGLLIIAVHVRVHADGLRLLVERNEVDVHQRVFFSVTARCEHIRHQGNTQQESLEKNSLRADVVPHLTHSLSNGSAPCAAYIKPPGIFQSAMGTCRRD